MKRMPLLAACVLAALGCLDAAAGDSSLFQVATLPSAPTTLDEITVRIATTHPLPAMEVLAATLVNHRWLIVEMRTTCVLAACPTFHQSFEVPFGLLPEGAYVIEVSLDGDYPRNYPLTVTAGLESPPVERFALEVEPAMPIDAGRTRLLVTTETLVCAPATLAGWNRAGNTVVVRLDRAESDPACLPPTEDATTLGGGSIDLGQLDPGVYLAELRDAADSGLLRSAPFTVADAGDGATLLGRYRVSMTWKTPDGQTGPARPIALGSPESALFAFFNLANWEVLVKVLDGCAINGHRWIFLAAATDVEFTLTVADLEGAAPPYVRTSPAGLFTLPLADTAAFACAP
jgi:hypothetical protein